MSRKSFAKRSRKMMRNKRNKSTRRQKRITRQRGGDMVDVERYILSLDLGPTATPKEKITYAGAVVRTIGPQYAPSALPVEDWEPKREAFINALEAIYVKHGVTDYDIELEQDEVENDLLDDAGADRLEGIANNIYAEFLKVGASPAVPGVADRTRFKRPREGEELGEFEQIQPATRETSVFTLETTVKPGAKITLSDGKPYNINEIRNMWTSNKSQTPLRHPYTEHDKAKIMAFINFAKGGKRARKTKKAKKTK
jgi:hypothetical protein